MIRSPAFDLRSCTRQDVVELFERNHGYKSVSGSITYCFGVFEGDHIVAAYAWQPPPPGAAKNVCPEAPQGVLALSRMVAVDKRERELKHISKPLKRQMKSLIDRTRWPVLVTYSDEGMGHNGYVYKCSGWTPTLRNKRPTYQNDQGQRCSPYSNGKQGQRLLTKTGTTWIQRWEHWICEHGKALDWMTSHGWRRVALEGRTWASGKQAYTYIREAA